MRKWISLVLLPRFADRIVEVYQGQDKPFDDINDHLGDLRR